MMKWSNLWLVVLLIISLTKSLVPSSLYKPYGMSLKILEKNSTCIATIDTRIAHFDNPIEWLQLSLQEPPCLKSRWILVVALPSELDPAVIGILQHHVSIDFIASNFDPQIGTVTHINPNSAYEFRPDSVWDKSSGRQVRDNRKLERKISRKIFSQTSLANILWAVIVSCLSGFIVNLSARMWGDKQQQRNHMYTYVPSPS